MFSRRPPSHVCFAALLTLASCASPAERAVAPIAPGAAVNPAVAPPTAPSKETAAAAPTTAPAAAIHSSDPVVRAMAAASRAHTKVDAFLQHLAGDIGPRLTGSHNLMRAEAWAVKQFKSMGLDARLERWGEIRVGFDRGPWSGAAYLPGREEPTNLDFTTPSWTPGVLGPVRSPAHLYPTTVAAARALAKTAEGHWIVHRRSDAKKLSKKLRDDIDRELRAAGKSGIAGFIYPATDASGELVHTFGRHHISWKKMPVDVTIYLRGNQHKPIVAKLDAGAKVELEFSIDNRFFRGPVPQYNVVADLRGSEFPDEYVVVGGHIDSWDGAQGAVDNGTGVASALEAARLLVAAGAKPRRTIRFILWSGEEQGLLGSQGYVREHADLMKKISAVLVHDGGTNYVSSLSVTPQMAEDMKAVFEPVFELDTEMPFALYYTDGMIPGGSDHNSFIAAGVPGFFWGQAGKADYQRAHHTQYDTLAAAVPAYQRHSALVIAIGAWGLAQRDRLLDRTDSSPLINARAAMGIEIDGTTFVAVTTDSDAWKMGFRPGDTVLAVDGTKVTSTMELARAVFGAKGDKILFGIKRKGRMRTLTADNGSAKLQRLRKERRARNDKRFGRLDYGGAPFAGRAPKKRFDIRRWLGGRKPKASATKKPAATSK